MNIGDLFSSMTGQGITQALDKLVQAYADQGRFNGAVLVARGGAVLLRKGYGVADRHSGASFTPQTPSRLASLTKPFTAIAILQLVEQGRLRLDEFLNRYYPYYPQAGRITLHHLLSNTSGIPDYIAMPAYTDRASQPMTLAEVMAFFNDLPLQFEPGREFGYSNSNWALLTGILEQVTGKPYAEVIRQQVFAPAWMSHSGYDWTGSPVAGRAEGIINTGVALIDSEPIHESNLLGAGGLYSTLDDLYGWSHALLQGKLLKPETLQHMRQPITGTAARGYGYGLELHAPFGHASIGHSGGFPGYVSNYAHFDDGDLTLIILSNLGSAAWESIHHGLTAILYDQPYALPGVREFVTVEPALLQAYAGDYDLTFMGRRFVTQFGVADDRLTMTIKGLPTAVLAPLAIDRFFGHSKGEVEITFRRGADGVVTGADFKWGEYDLTAPRM